MKEPVDPRSVAASEKRSNYPEPFARRMAGREKRALGEAYGLTNFGVVHVTLAPGGESALKHAHSRQDEFVIGISGRLTVEIGHDRYRLDPGEVVGFPAGGEAHRILNETEEPGAFIVIGDRTAADAVTYPDDDLVAQDVGAAWRFTKKDGTPY